jgi:hypothetical protein
MLQDRMLDLTGRALKMNVTNGIAYKMEKKEFQLIFSQTVRAHCRGIRICGVPAAVDLTAPCLSGTRRNVREDLFQRMMRDLSRTAQLSGASRADLSPCDLCECDSYFFSGYSGPFTVSVDKATLSLATLSLGQLQATDAPTNRCCAPEENTGRLRSKGFPARTLAGRSRCSDHKCGTGSRKPSARRTTKPTPRQADSIASESS